VTNDSTDFEAALATWDPDATPNQRVDPVDVLALAERLLRPDAPPLPPPLWHAYLDYTRCVAFLSALPGRAHRERWAETTFAAIRHSDFTLETLLDQRARSHPGRIFLREARGANAWTYEQARHRIRSIASVLHALGPGHPPNVAILSDNSLDSACIDLACLAYDMFVVPFDVQLDIATLAWAFDRLEIDLAVSGDARQAARLDQVRSVAKQPFRILHLQADAPKLVPGDVDLVEEMSRSSREDVARHLSMRARRSLEDPATVLFTSGSTGTPKGVVFSPYHLLTKRFARGAALPAVGEAEIFLCYLPLYHTFGRYLELQGSLYWGGTYVFAGNPSIESLLELMPQARPTGFISIPLRWAQIRDRCLDSLDATANEEAQRWRLRALVGDRLRWGLSAAGHLDPRVFRFFNQSGIALCSGFGMTEATGGITMTPPGEYVDGTVGIALPGMEIKLTEVGELEIAGPYVASYLDEDHPAEAPSGWLATGDLFRKHANGFLEIVDRVKDIYKNSRGQTIAPRRVEALFEDVPGIRRTFLVGDGRDYNVLLVSVDRDDPVVQAFSSADALDEYLRHIVAVANRSLVRHERIVNFTVLGRDFELARGELTAKGSYRRKVIEQDFAEEVRALYTGRTNEIACQDVPVQVPRWVCRDQGWLERDIQCDERGLWVRGDGRRLSIQRMPSGRIKVGDLEYAIGARGVVDLGMFARQPLLWVGNPELARFCPCKEGWESPLEQISPQVVLPAESSQAPEPTPDISWIGDYQLGTVHSLATQALFSPAAAALPAVTQLGELLGRVHTALASLIRRRLEALARHPDLPVRCLAYRTLLLETVVPETSEMMPSFIESGLPFLDEESIEVIARTHLEHQRLEALRQRLHRYRAELTWPTSDAVRVLFGDVFQLLCNFVRYHPEYFPEVRLELNAWVLHDADPTLAAVARERLVEITTWWENHLFGPGTAAGAWRPHVLYHEAVGAPAEARLEHLLRQTLFLAKSIALAFEDTAADPEQVEQEGTWVSRLPSLQGQPTFRVSVNTAGRHYDLVVVLNDDAGPERARQIMRWMMAIDAHPFGMPVVPRFGWYDPNLHAMSYAYIQDLTVFERIREFASLRVPGMAPAGTAQWRELFVRAMAAIFVGWQKSGWRIVPGPPTPFNVVVLAPDFRQGAYILSLDDWKHYASPLSIVRPLVDNFYRQTTSHYPWCRRALDLRWIFEACMEAIGEERTRVFLAELRTELDRSALQVLGESLATVLDAFVESLDHAYYAPLALRSAIDRYHDWSRENPHAGTPAREQVVQELLVVYGLDRYPEVARYHLYRSTYFAHAEPAVCSAFDHLLAEMFAHQGQLATTMVELSELQAAIRDPDDIAVFARMAFPHNSPEERLEVLAVGSGQKQVIVRSHVEDREGRVYNVREPVDAPEVGRLYRRYVQAGFPRTISSDDSFYVMLDSRDEIVGGVIYRRESPTVAHLRGIVVRHELKGRGLNGELLEDFCRRMANQGVEVVRTFFFARRFYMQHGFHVDRRWGGLVRVLGEDG
jgi:long-chain acyl-CoA synthetase